MKSLCQRLQITLSLVACLIALITTRQGYSESHIVTALSDHDELSRSIADPTLPQPKQPFTSREMRRSIAVQASAHASLFPPLAQFGVDVDYLLDEQTALGLSSNQKMTISIMDYEKTSRNYSLHLKRFIGNSFFVKPAIGVHTIRVANMDRSKMSESGLGLQVELGNEWFFSEHFGMNLSYGAIGVMYNAKAQQLHLTTLIPAIRLFGAF